MKYAVVFGGASYEHEISIVSAIALKKVLKNIEKFIFLDSNGEFFLIPKERMKSSHFSNKEYEKNLKLLLQRGGFLKKGIFKSAVLDGYDAVINLVHGAEGEDGTLASLFDFYGIRYIGPRKEASIISFNKWLTKLYAKGVGVNSLKYQLLKKDSKRDVNFNLPVIVKPLRLGSSIGVKIAKEQNELDYALDTAFEFDDEVLIEPFIKGVKEFNIAGFKVGKNWHIGSIEAPKKDEFLDFEQKYLDFSRVESATKADIDKNLEKELIYNFKKVYADIFEGAIIRCDFFVENGNILLNEINPIPGSLAHYLFENFQESIDNLSDNLPKARSIKPDYRYIGHVQSAKGPKAGRVD